MLPLFDQETELVGWLNTNDGNVFDTEMGWIAFVQNGHAWSAETGNWLGSVNGLTMLDQDGRPVAWSTKQAPQGTMKPPTPPPPMMPLTPLTPLNPLNPLQPMRPLIPIGGWSDMSWEEWITQE
jgi:hypothetical protein